LRRFVPFQTAQFWREGAAPVTTEFTIRVNVSLPAAITVFLGELYQLAR